MYHRTAHTNVKTTATSSAFPYFTVIDYQSNYPRCSQAVIRISFLFENYFILFTQKSMYVKFNLVKIRIKRLFCWAFYSLKKVYTLYKLLLVIWTKYSSGLFQNKFKHFAPELRNQLLNFDIFILFFYHLASWIFISHQMFQLLIWSCTDIWSLYSGANSIDWKTSTDKSIQVMYEIVKIK